MANKAVTNVTIKVKSDGAIGRSGSYTKANNKTVIGEREGFDLSIRTIENLSVCTCQSDEPEIRGNRVINKIIAITSS